MSKGDAEAQGGTRGYFEQAEIWGTLQGLPVRTGASKLRVTLENEEKEILEVLILIMVMVEVVVAVRLIMIGMG